MSVGAAIFNALYYIFPAYCANGAPVLFGGGRPIDNHRKLSDGNPIFGPHKTCRGFLAGIVIGTIVGASQQFLAPQVGLPEGSIFLGFVLSLGALSGDLFGSFIKRRFNLKPGAPLPIFDQIDFVLFALLFSLPLTPPSVTTAIIVVFLTLPIHLLVNIVAYFLSLKKTPW